MDDFGFDQKGGLETWAPEGFESEEAWLEYFVSLASQLPAGEEGELTFPDNNVDGQQGEVTPVFGSQSMVPLSLPGLSTLPYPQAPSSVATDVELPDIMITSPTTATISPDATRQTFYLPPEYAPRGHLFGGPPSFEYLQGPNGFGLLHPSGRSLAPVFGMSSDPSNPNRIPVSAPPTLPNINGLSPPRPPQKNPNQRPLPRLPSASSSHVTIIPRHKSNYLPSPRPGIQPAATVGISKRARSASPRLLSGVPRPVPRFGGQADAGPSHVNYRHGLRTYRDPGPVLSISSVAHRRARSVPPTPAQGVSFLDMDF